MWYHNVNGKGGFPKVWEWVIGYLLFFPPFPLVEVSNVRQGLDRETLEINGPNGTHPILNGKKWTE